MFLQNVDELLPDCIQKTSHCCENVKSDMFIHILSTVYYRNEDLYVFLHLLFSDTINIRVDNRVVNESGKVDGMRVGRRN
jgi:hypothetical protein